MEPQVRDQNFEESGELLRVGEVNRALGRLEGKLDYLSIQITSHFDDDRHQFSELQRRLTGTEKKLYVFSGMFAVIAALSSYFAHFFNK